MHHTCQFPTPVQGQRFQRKVVKKSLDIPFRRWCVCEWTEREMMEIHDFWGGSQGEALAPQPSPTFNLKPLATVEVEIRDALWQILDIP